MIFHSILSQEEVCFIMQADKPVYPTYLLHQPQCYLYPSTCYLRKYYVVGIHVLPIVSIYMDKLDIKDMIYVAWFCYIEKKSFALTEKSILLFGYVQ